MTLSQISTRTQPRAYARPALLRRLLLAILFVLTAGALGNGSAAAATDPQLSLAQLESVYGGTCSSQCGNDDDEDDDDDDDDDARRTGSPYWVETRRSLNSRDSGRASLEDMVINRSSSPLDTEFSYRHRTVRRIDFGGGWGKAFSVKVGGERDVTRTRTLSKTLRPYQVGKIYTRLVMSRYTVRGAYYQDYTDGSRRKLRTSSGPYRRGHTVASYVTRSLN